jgi:glucosamine-6-phosphate deaminase
MRIRSIRTKVGKSVVELNTREQFKKLPSFAAGGFSAVGTPLSVETIASVQSDFANIMHEAIFFGVLDVFHREFTGRVLDLNDNNLFKIQKASESVIRQVYRSGMTLNDLPGMLFEPYGESVANSDSFGNIARREILSLHQEPRWISRAKRYEPELIVCEEDREVAEAAGDIIGSEVKKTPQMRLGCATGNSPKLLFSYLEELAASGVNFSRIIGSYLDEYICDPAVFYSAMYVYYISKRVAGPLKISNFNFFAPNAKSLSVEARSYEKKILMEGPIDLQILGIGDNRDVHIAFNQKYSSFRSRARVMGISAPVRMKNARDFQGQPDQVPDFAFTLGLSTLRDHVDRILLIATGEAKRESVRLMFEKPTEEVPASILLLRPNVTVVVDKAANPF